MKISTTLGTKRSGPHRCSQMVHIWSTRLDMHHRTSLMRNLGTSRLDIECGLQENGERSQQNLTQFTKSIGYPTEGRPLHAKISHYLMNPRQEPSSGDAWLGCEEQFVKAGGYNPIIFRSKDMNLVYDAISLRKHVEPDIIVMNYFYFKAG
ncbi:hypothetical protein ACS0TY_004433 [Phlomoides rotata]